MSIFSLGCLPVELVLCDVMGNIELVPSFSLFCTANGASLADWKFMVSRTLPSDLNIDVIVTFNVELMDKNLLLWSIFRLSLKILGVRANM